MEMIQTVNEVVCGDDTIVNEVVCGNDTNC